MVNLSGRTFDHLDAVRLQNWVSSGEQGFNPDEQYRARSAVSYLKSKIRGQSGLRPRGSVSTLINLVLVFVLLFNLMGLGRGGPLWAEINEHGTPSEVSVFTFMAYAPYLLVFLCFAGILVGWAKWLRVIISILGFIGLLWLFPAGMIAIVSAQGGVGGFAAFAFIGLIVWFIILVVKSGDR